VTWEGKGVNEIGKNDCGDIIVRVDSKYFRPTEVDLLLGDNTKIKKNLGWEPTYTFDELIICMVKSDIKKLKI
jgi:GDPmannose 4,6-dehydratase